MKANDVTGHLKTSLNEELGSIPDSDFSVDPEVELWNGDDGYFLNVNLASP